MKTREKLKNLGKRTLSCIMALSMCMTLVPDVTVFADETTDTEITTEVASYDSTEGATEPTTRSQTEEVANTEKSDDGTYTVTLDSVDGGEICFYSSETDTTESVADKRIVAGSSVGIKFMPENGYKVSSFTISDADKNELYRDETSDDVFEFTMPEMNIVVGGSFAKTMQGTEASSDTEENTDETSSDTPGIKLEGNGAKIIGDTSGSKPDYLDDMNAYTAKILGTSTTAIAATIKANQNKLNTSVMAVDRTDTSGYGVVACADLIDNAYESATGFSINSSLAREVFNRLRENDDNWEIVYKNIAYTDSSKTVKLRAGDMVLLSDTDNVFDPDGTISDGSGVVHVFYIYDVSADGDVWMATCNGDGITYICNFNQYFGLSGVNIAAKQVGDEIVLEEVENTTGLTEGKDYYSITGYQKDEIEQRISEGKLDNVEDVNIALEGNGESTHLSVLRYNDDAPYMLKISKLDKTAAKGKGVSVRTYTTANNKTTYTTSTVTCDHIAATNSKYYNRVSAAKFTMYKGNGEASVKAANKIKNIYTDKDFKNKAANGSLVRNKGYYINPDEMGDTWDGYVTIVETAPKGWNGNGTVKSVKLVKDKLKTVTFSDSFRGDPISLTLKKSGSDGKALAGVKFKLTDDSDVNGKGTHRSWVFETDKNGEIYFDDPSYIVSGPAFMTSTNEIQFFAGSYTLSEVAAPSGYLVKGEYALYDSNNNLIAGSGNTFDKTGSSDNNIVKFNVTIGTDGVASAELGRISLTNKSLSISNNPEVYSLSIAKTDGGAVLNYNTYTNGKAGADKTVSKSSYVSNNSLYGKIADARFSAYVTKADGTTVHISRIYTKPECTTESLVADSTKLVPGTTYYIPRNNLKDYAATNGNVSVSFRESVAPKGWTKAADKTVTLAVNSLKTISFSDTYYGTGLSFSLVKENVDGKTLAGAEYTLTNTSDGRKWVFKTDANGVVKFYDPAYLVSGDGIFYKNPTTGNKSLRYFGGSYTLVETKAPDDYMSEGKITFTFPDGTTPSASFKDGGNLINIYINPLSDGSGKVEVKMNAHEITGNTKAVVVNTAEPHSFVINKADGTAKNKYTAKTYKNGEETGSEELSCDDIAKENSLYGRLSSATFTVTKDDKAKTIYDDEDCTKIHSGSLKAGVTYWMKDTPAGSKFNVTETSPKGWSGTGDKKTLTIKKASEGAASVSFTDRFYGTNFRLTLTKQSVTGGRLAGAVFKLTCANGSSTNDLIYVTDKNGEIDFSDPAYLQSGRVIFGSTGKIALFAGNYTLTEIKAPTGYLAKGWYITSTDSNTRIRFNGRVTEFSITSDSDGKAQVAPGTIDLGGGSVTVTETPKVMGFELDKVNNDTEDNTLLGGMTDYTTKFEVIYVGRDGDTDDSYAWVDYNGDGECTDDEKIAKGEKVKAPGTDDTIWASDENGHYSCPAILQTGTYKIVETEPPKGLLADSEYDTFEITFPADWTKVADKEIIKIDRPLDNSMVRGGVAGFKYDYDTMTNSAMAGSSFDGIEFWVENANENSVWLDVNGDGKIDESDRELKAGEQVQIGKCYSSLI